MVAYAAPGTSSFCSPVAMDTDTILLALGGRVAATILLLSLDQAQALKAPSATTRSGPPGGETRMIFLSPRVKAIHRPSGDQIGFSSRSGSRVSRNEGSAPITFT